MDVPENYRDIDWEGLTHARRSLIGNPYATPQQDLDEAMGWFLANEDSVPRAMIALCEMKRPGDARKLAISNVHALARRKEVRSRLRHLTDALDLVRSKGVQLEREDVTRLARALERFSEAEGRLLGTSQLMHALREEIWTLCFGPNLFETLAQERALRRLNVVILGESGTGKERVADLIRAASFTSSDPPSIAVNCAALPKELAESELFGVEKGAHSMAYQRRTGKIVAASGGTLFLDEVADLPGEVQAKLLSTMSNGEVTPLGSNEVKLVDVRYVSATQRPLVEMAATGQFREDLYQRLAGRLLIVPPLRDRRDDIVSIGRDFLKRERAFTARTQGDLSSDLGAGLKAEEEDERWLRQEASGMPWKGNVRELEAVLRQRVLGLRPQLGAIHLRGPSGERLDVPDSIIRCEATEQDVVDWYMTRVLEKTAGNQSEAMRILNINRSTIRRRLGRRTDEDSPEDPE